MKNNLSFPLARHARCATKANGRPDINSRIQQVTVDNNPAAPRWVNLSDLIGFFFFLERSEDLLCRNQYNVE